MFTEDLFPVEKSRGIRNGPTSPLVSTNNSVVTSPISVIDCTSLGLLVTPMSSADVHAKLKMKYLQALNLIDMNQQNGVTLDAIQTKTLSQSKVVRRRQSLEIAEMLDNVNYIATSPIRLSSKKSKKLFSSAMKSTKSSSEVVSESVKKPKNDSLLRRFSAKATKSIEEIFSSTFGEGNKDDLGTTTPSTKKFSLLAATPAYTPSQKKGKVVLQEPTPMDSMVLKHIDFLDKTESQDDIVPMLSLSSDLLQSSDVVPSETTSLSTPSKKSEMTISTAASERARRRKSILKKSESKNLSQSFANQLETPGKRSTVVAAAVNGCLKMSTTKMAALLHSMRKNDIFRRKSAVHTLESHQGTPDSSARLCATEGASPVTPNLSSPFRTMEASRIIDGSVPSPVYECKTPTISSTGKSVLARFAKTPKTPTLPATETKIIAATSPNVLDATVNHLDVIFEDHEARSPATPVLRSPLLEKLSTPQSRKNSGCMKISLCSHSSSSDAGDKENSLQKAKQEINRISPAIKSPALSQIRQNILQGKATTPSSNEKVRSHHFKSPTTSSPKLSESSTSLSSKKNSSTPLGSRSVNLGSAKRCSSSKKENFKPSPYGSSLTSASGTKKSSYVLSSYTKSPKLSPKPEEKGQDRTLNMDERSTENNYNNIMNDCDSILNEIGGTLYETY